MLRAKSNVSLSRLMVFGLCSMISLAAIAAPPKYQLTRLGRLGYAFSQGTAINNRGDVMGELDLGGTYVRTRTFLYKDGTMTAIAPDLRRNNSGWAINNNGDIVGTLFGDVFLFKNGKFSRLSTPQDRLITAFDINDSGQIIGYGTPAGGFEQVYLYDNGAISYLPTGPFSELFVTDINNRGEITGGGEFFPGGHAFLFSNGTTVDLGTIDGGGNSFGSAINESAQVTGRATNADGHLRAFLYSDGSMRDLGTLGGNESLGFGINRSGHVVGQSQTASGNVHAFVYKDGAMVDLGAPGGFQSEANTITDNGIVAGLVTKVDGVMSVFIYGVDGNITHDLNDLIDSTEPLKPYVKLYDIGHQKPARAVNGLGQVLAIGSDSRTGKSHTYIVSPIDSTKPVIKTTFSGTQGTNGWYTSNVGVNWTVTDAQAPIADTTGCASATVTTDTTGQKFTCRARSIGGLASKIVTIKRDTTRPGVSISRPGIGVVFDRNQVVTASYTCADATAGVSTCIGSVPNGSRIDTSRRVTDAIFSVKATDDAGITRTVTRSYSVN